MNIGHIANALLKPIGVKLSRIEEEANSLQHKNRYELDSETLDGIDRETRKVLNLLNYTKQSDSTYNAELYDSGYHSIQLKEFTFSGQRKPDERLADVPFDFTDKIVLDIGCNQGGMLFAVADRARRGIGLDYDARMINAANRIKAYKELGNADFFVFDLEKENLNVIDNFLPDTRVDIVFLLSVCMWVHNWQDVIIKARGIADAMLFESNGTAEQQVEQESFLRGQFHNVELLRDSSPDDPRQKARKLYLCRA